MSKRIWRPVATPAHSLTYWTKSRIDVACMQAYRQYERELQEHYTAYFVQYPQLRSHQHRYSAFSLSAALPPGHADLQRLIPRAAQHRFICSARSSQGLALSLLGVAAKVDPSLRWFWDALQLPFHLNTAFPTSCTFEYLLDSEDLNERPRTSQLDLLIRHRTAFACVEGKWGETLGSCSCRRECEGSPMPGASCAERIYDRAAYWSTAQDTFALPSQRSPLLPCPISTVYQVVRNVAAVRHLAGNRRHAVFVLLYDARNPYFSRTGNWPGWPRLLFASLAHQAQLKFHFRAFSWQDLVSKLPLPRDVRNWALEKHCLC